MSKIKKENNLEKNAAVKIVMEGRRTGKGAYTQTVIFSIRQKKEIQPHKVEHSRTGNHWTNTWFLFPGKYILSKKDISNSGKHNCYISLMEVTEEGYELIEGSIPEWLLEIPCDCLNVHPDY